MVDFDGNNVGKYTVHTWILWVLPSFSDEKIIYGFFEEPVVRSFDTSDY